MPGHLAQSPSGSVSESESVSLSGVDSRFDCDNRLRHRSRLQCRLRFAQLRFRVRRPLVLSCSAWARAAILRRRRLPMKRMLLTMLAVAAGVSAAWACTVIAVGKKASADGSVILPTPMPAPTRASTSCPAATQARRRERRSTGASRMLAEPLHDDSARSWAPSRRSARTYAYFHSAYSAYERAPAGHRREHDQPARRAGGREGQGRADHDHRAGP